MTASIIDNFLDAHRFTKQTRRELAEWIPEIAYRENIAASDVINDDCIGSILRDEKLNDPQKHKKIRDELYRRRFPEFSKLQDIWKKSASVNPNPSKIRFIPSPGFEKKRLEIRITVDNSHDIENIFKSLLKIDPSVWDSLLYPKS